ncbi:MAG: adenylyltransferase/cytidyltransferase family protein [bacterium]|nr:adenylyltransferase/cytidyltransferase family protein [bacterium]
MTKVMVFGTFDILHPGHLNFFKQAKKYGDYLIVVVARDRTVLGVKGKLPRHSERQRLKAVKQTGLVDMSVLGRTGDKYGIIKQHKPNIVTLGYDQRFFTDELKANLIKFGLNKTKIVKLKAYKPKKYKSSILKFYPASAGVNNAD